MPFVCAIDQQQRLALLTFSGSITGAELLAATEALYRDPAWTYGGDAIWDFSNITELLLEWEDLTRLVELDRSFEDVAGPGRDLFVVSRQLDEAMGRAHMHLSKAGPRQSQVCHSLAQAREIAGRARME